MFPQASWYDTDQEVFLMDIELLLYIYEMYKQDVVRSFTLKSLPEQKKHQIENIAKNLVLWSTS